ncbi:alpha,alpha-phosphotrehalase [Sporolactobacillus pectinivorans]|uniref:alpha,alpha-phosphotrehalase n=1 Tax=Sporolactobacillus pectinivorans TaxID=1591408 RepID=UPI000C2630A0|nr:alpha,alpha-phosphotrehalase [Sporolactobacillus pectinivorans]
MDFRNKVIYQIYPKSFYDSDHDGIGDLRGIIEKIPYIVKLNVNMIWFNPFFVSPQKDNGYDVADYRAVDPRLGTMEDFEELVAKLKAHQIDVMLDMVFNHTSTKHEWFQKALNGSKKYQDYYIIKEPKPNGGLPTNWTSKFGGPAWEKFGSTDRYYLHLYDKSQADLNWRNPEVRNELYSIINFWMTKGVKGFRFDVINVTGKDARLVDAKPGEESKSLYTDKPVVHDYLQEMNRESFGKAADTVTVGEMSSTSIENSVGYTNPDNHELTMVFSFHHLKVDYQNGEKWTKTKFDFMKLKRILDNWQSGMAKGNGWNALFWNNHDQPRAINRFGDPGEYRVKSAQMLATVIHLLRGTPYIYMGEEIGMTDPDYHGIGDYDDIEAINAYHALLKKGLSENEAFDIVHAKARDNSRTPMQWADKENAGFSSHQPWLKPTNYRQINVEKELNEGSIFNYYQKLIQLRKNDPIVSHGGYESLLMDHPDVFAYFRTYQNQKLLVLNNFFKRNTAVTVPDQYLSLDSRVLISNYDRQTFEKSIILKPYEAIAFLLIDRESGEQHV